MPAEFDVTQETDEDLARRFGHNREAREAFERATGRHITVTPEAARKTAAATAPRPKPSPPKLAAPAPRAVYRAPTVSPERAARTARNRKVMASSAAQGREDQAIDLIADTTLSADAIIAKLAGAPTDFQVAAKVRQDAVDAIWDKASRSNAR